MVFKKNNWPWPMHTSTRQLPLGQKHIGERLRTAFKLGFDSVILQLFSDEYLSSKEKLQLDESTIPSDEHFDNRSHTRNVMLQINPVIDVVQEKWRKAFEFIVGYAVYLGLFGIVLHMPTKDYVKVAECLNSYAQRGQLGNLRVTIRVNVEADEASVWQDYIHFRALLTSITNVDLMLVLGKDLPSDLQFRRWIGERVEYICISPESFVTNTKGHPVLAIKHSEYVKNLICHKAVVVIEQTQPQENLEGYLKFVQFMFEKMRQMSPNELQSMRFYDLLQEPLQPYYDNLQSETYSVFESDNAKYDEYEMALQRAFLTFPKDQRITIFYIGSGRGQLIYSSMNASKKTNRAVYIYAIEKNPYPIQSLKRRIQKNKWQNYVQIVETDVKLWQPSIKADIFLSELLGGFGDNELSPECLSWAQRHLQKGTICIPQRYSALCSPISSSCIYRKLKEQDKEKYYVAKLHNIYRPSGVQKLWTFEHPLKPDESFERKGECLFVVEQNTLIHGFAGYFDCDLYENCRLSTNPEQHTPDMYSWFAVFFPLMDPILVKDKEKLLIRVWRKTKPEKVWYEWQVDLISDTNTVLKSTIVHNVDGERLSILK